MRALAAVLFVVWVSTGQAVALGTDQAVADQQRSTLVVREGGNLCQTWLDERRNAGTSVLAFGLEEWVLGFVLGQKIEDDDQTGIVVPPYENPTWLTNVTVNDVLTRIDVYCRTHQRALIVQAALVVVADLLSEWTKKIETTQPPRKR
jgi:hypothetical protein